MALKTLGFFHELPLNERVERLQSLRRSECGPDEANLIAYLRSGAVSVAVPGVDLDVLRTPPRPIGPPHIRTDGVWAWPETLAYYVQQYHLRLPDEFLQHAMKNQWACPASADEADSDLQGHIEMG